MGGERGHGWGVPGAGGWGRALPRGGFIGDKEQGWAQASVWCHASPSFVLLLLRMAQRGTARNNAAWHGSARLSTARHGSGWHSTAWHGMAQLGTARHGTAQLVMAWHSTAQHGTARLSMARHSSAQLVAGQQPRGCPHTSKDRDQEQVSICPCTPTSQPDPRAPSHRAPASPGDTGVTP